ncbi:MAG: FemAB family protein [Spirochaetes bacterium ADurb.Bin110]|nr:MAG: FemAB family protein [Spirochaetes bacterium ADurb.Bin110]
MKVKSITVQEWEEFVKSLPNYNFFQLPIWSQAYERTYPNCRIATRFFIFDDGIQVLVPLIETRNKLGFRSYESLSGGGYGGFIWNKMPSNWQLKKILSYFFDLRASSLTIFPDPFDWQSHLFLEEEGFHAKEAFTHILNLDSDFGLVWANRFDSKNRNQVRKALKSGVMIIPATNISEVKIYYDLYLESAHRWGAQEESIRPFRFFKNLFQIGGDKVRFYLAKYEEKYISGAIIFYGDMNCFYWSSVLLKEYGKYCSNNLLLSNIIQSACNDRYRFLNMGASIGLPGVQRFKESFGAEKLNYKYFVYESLGLKLYKKMRLAFSLLRNS